MKLICENQVTDVAKLLATVKRSVDLDCEHYYFTMHLQQVDKVKEKKVVSPLAVAVLTGNPLLLHSLLESMQLWT